MSLKRLTAFVVISCLCGLGVFMASLLAMTTAQGGQYTIHLNLYGEMWAEYWAGIVLMATAPYAMWAMSEIIFAQPEGDE